MEMELGMPPVVKVLQVCQISPPSGSVSPTSLPLTYFDVIYLSMRPVQRLFYYHVHHTKTHFMDAVLPNLKHSLSLTLQHLFPLAGNLTWPPESAEPKIVYKEGDAVSLTFAESDLDFDLLSSNQARDAMESYPLIPMFRSRSSDDKQVPLLALQVTFFPNKGICIGMAINHVASDGRSTIHFMKSWASVCLLQGDTSLITPPFYERSLLDFLNPKKTSFLNALEKNNITKDTFHSLNNHHSPPVGKVLATYVMIHSDIKLLKQWVSTRLKEEINETTLRLTSFVVTCAYVWVCFVKARVGGDNQTEAIEYLIVPADARGRLVPPLPTTYFGNCLVGSIVKCSRSGLMGKDGIATAAKLIGNEIQNIDLYKQLEKDMISEYLSMPREQILVIASSPRFGVYDIDFGWGKPKFVEMSSINTGRAISVSEWAHEEGGLEFGLVRNKIEMETFARIFADSLKTLS